MPNEEEKNQAYEESDVLYEDNNIIVVSPHTLVAAKYFGPEFVVKRWAEYYRSKNVVLLYDKKENLHYVIYKPIKDRVDILDDKGFDMDIDYIENKYPKLSDVLTDLFEKSSIYSALKQISEGVEISEYDLKRMDDLIGGYTFNKTNPKKSTIRIEFDDMKEYLKLFDLDDDDINFVDSLFSYYHSYRHDNDFYSYYMGSDDWREGYIMREFNEDNIKKVKNLLMYLSPKILGMDGDEFYQESSKILSELFPRQVNYIINEYVNMREECSRETAKKDIKADLSNRFYYQGIFEKVPFEKYFTNIRILLNLFELTKKTRGSIKDVLKDLLKDVSVGPYEEYRFEFGCDNPDYESFHSTVERELEEIEEKISEGEFTSDVNELQKIVDDVISKYGIRQTHKLPKNPEKTFYIDSVDPKTNKIVVVLSHYKGLKGSQQKRSLGLEEFYNFLYHPELFEGWKRKKLK